MSTIKSSDEHLTINADGSGNDIKFQSNGTEVASISDGGVVTATSFSGSGANLTGVGVDGISSSADATAITIDSSERVGIGTTSPDSNSKLHVYNGASGQSAATNNTEVVIENNSTTGISFLTPNNASSGLWFADPESNASGRFYYTHSDNSLNVFTGGTQRLKIDGDGLKFNTDTAAANALDDYEEGTWTPTLGANSGRSGTWSSTLGIYTKIGNIVHLYIGITGSAMYFTSELGYQNITGLPFTAANPTGYSNYSGSWSGDAVTRSSGGHLYLHTTNIYMHARNESPATSGVSGFGCYISYRTND